MKLLYGFNVWRAARFARYLCSLGKANNVAAYQAAIYYNVDSHDVFAKIKDFH